MNNKRGKKLLLKVSSLKEPVNVGLVQHKTSNTKNTTIAASAQIPFDCVVFGAKKPEPSVPDKIQLSAKKLDDGGQLKKLLSKYRELYSSKMTKVDVSQSLFSSTKEAPPNLKVIYNIWDDYLFSYSFEEDGVQQTRTFNKKGDSISTTIERNLEDVKIITSYIGREKRPFSILVKNDTERFYSQAGHGSVEKRYAQASKTSTASTLEFYEYILSDISIKQFSIAYPNKNEKNYRIYSGQNAKAETETLELAREQVFELASRSCGRSGVEKLKKYAQLLHMEEDKK